MGIPRNLGWVPQCWISKFGNEENFGTKAGRNKRNDANQHNVIDGTRGSTKIHQESEIQQKYRLNLKRDKIDYHRWMEVVIPKKISKQSNWLRIRKI